MAVTFAVRHLGGSEPGAPQSLTFDQPRIVIGRGAHADVRLPSRAVSETHAVVRVDSGELSVTDEGSTNGTAVNGSLLVHGRKKILRPGDVLTVPGFELRVNENAGVADARERTATVARKLLLDAVIAAGGESAPPQLVLGTGRRAGQRWSFPPAPSRLVAGRGEQCEILLDDPDCSRQHAEFLRDEHGVMVRDLSSKNGVQFGGRPVAERRLRDEDVLVLGRSTLGFVDPTEALLRSLEVGRDEPAPGGPSAPVPDPPPAPPVETAPAPEPAPTGESTAKPVTEEPVKAPIEQEIPKPKRVPQRRSVDWVVALLAVVILAVSLAALYFLLRTTPTAR